MMGRQHGAYLWSGMHHDSRVSKKLNQRNSNSGSLTASDDNTNTNSKMAENDTEGRFYSSLGQRDDILQKLKSIRDVTTLKDWRHGITGNIQFSIKVIITEDSCEDSCDEMGGEGGDRTRDISSSSRSSSWNHSCAPCSRSNDDDTSNDIQDQSEGQERRSVDKSCVSSPPTQNPLYCSTYDIDEVSELPTSTVTDGRKCSNKSSPAIHSKTGVFLCIEIEKCLDLKISPVFQFSKRRRYRKEGILGKEPMFIRQKSLCPFVLIKLNDREVGRTPALRNTRNPIWYDECFQFPICDKCTDLTLEVWEEIPTKNEHNSKSSNGKNQLVGEFVGRCSLNIQNLMNKEVVTDDGVHNKFHNYNLQLRRWFDDTKTHINSNCRQNNDGGIDEYGKSNSCSCPSQEQKEKNLHDAPCPSSSRRETVRVQAVGNSFKRKRKRLPSILVEKPDNASTMKRDNFKVDNPAPFRRKDIREMDTEGDSDSLLNSTYFRALSLMIIYIIVGVVGFSYVFESWTIRDSVYFSVVTFSTVGYGDIRPSSDGAKLFSCVFALMGIGIIGIALGYIGQNLVQAQIAALQRSQRRKEDPIQENRGLMKSLPLVRNVIIFICPIAVMIIFGSVVVGTYEKWDVIDSIYWCIMTGTSVGYGDFAPRTSGMRWFSVIYIPLSVGCTSAALGRIANVFVEQEIAKANTKLLKREVTLEDLEVMNADGDGEVSPLEFIEYMLKVMHKVDQNLLDELHTQFEKLDADGSGGLQQDDLELLTERKLKERRQQAIERYRSSLLNENDGRELRRWSYPQIIPNG